MTKLLLAAAIAAAAVAPARPVDAPKPESRDIDLVICLDVSGSMEGLIDATRAKLWDIVNDLARARPSPNLRVGLYSYGHTNYRPMDGWVRKEVDLTTDLDEVNKRLFGLTINGGEEYVARVCRDALAQQKWSPDPNALKLIFVCGNEPATQDKVVKLPEVAKLAKELGVIINTVYCGPAAHPETKDWREFASSCGGKFASIDHNRGAAAIATPQDKELAELSGQLSRTYLAYGRDGAEKKQNQELQDLNAQKAGVPAAAARGAAKAGGVYRNGTWDLLDRMKDDPKFDLAKVPQEELPEEMRKMSADERAAFLKKKQAERADIQKRIAELNQAREAFIRETLKNNPSAGEQAFDAAVRTALREQAAAKGISIPE